jgi:hypothetical protein
MGATRTTVCMCTPPGSHGDSPGMSCMYTRSTPANMERPGSLGRSCAWASRALLWHEKICSPPIDSGWHVFSRTEPTDPFCRPTCCLSDHPRTTSCDLTAARRQAGTGAQHAGDAAAASAIRSGNHGIQRRRAPLGNQRRHRPHEGQRHAPPDGGPRSRPRGGRRRGRKAGPLAVVAASVALALTSSSSLERPATELICGACPSHTGPETDEGEVAANSSAAATASHCWRTSRRRRRARRPRTAACRRPAAALGQVRAVSITSTAGCSICCISRSHRYARSPRAAACSRMTADTRTCWTPMPL